MSDEFNLSDEMFEKLFAPMEKEDYILFSYPIQNREGVNFLARVPSRMVENGNAISISDVGTALIITVIDVSQALKDARENSKE